jgi:hypothetical protein
MVTSWNVSLLDIEDVLGYPNHFSGVGGIIVQNLMETHPWLFLML